MEYRISDRMAPMQGSAIREIFKYAADPSVISLAGGNPAPELFPNEALAAIAGEVLREQPVTALQYGITEGYAPLREAVKGRLRRVERIGGPDDELIVVSGGQQGIELMTKVLVNEGDTVLVEEPSFIGATNAFRSYGAHLAGVPVEDDGIDVAALERAVQENRNVRFLYTIPTFQNPMGVTMSVEKRKAVYELAKRYGFLILEDNPYGELTFSGEKKPTLKSMDTEGIVIYCGSFSKILAPGIRVGYIVAPAPIVKRMAEAKQANDTHSPMITQLMVYEYLQRHDIGENIQRMRDLYSKKCRLMLDEADAFFPASVTHTTPGGGLFVWCDMGGDYDTIEVYKECIGHKVAFVPGAPFMADPSKRCSAFRLNYSTMPDEKIAEGMRILGNALKKIMA